MEDAATLNIDGYASLISVGTKSTDRHGGANATE
jgi:hypothetical protein